MELTPYFWSDDFPQSLVREINKDFAAQQLREPLRELVYLVLMVRMAGNADLGSRAVNSFFFATKSWKTSYVKDWFAARESPFLQASEKEITLEVDAGPFRIGYGRILYLAAVYYFFLGISSNDVFEDEIEAIYANASTKQCPKDRSIKDLINRLSKDLYEYTMQMVPGIKVRQKYLSLLGWLKEDHIETLHSSAINDEKLIEFWKENAKAKDKIGDFVTFEKVVQAFVSIFHCLQAAEVEARADYASAFGLGFEDGGISSDVLADTLKIEYETEAGEILDRLLDEPASEIKFLNAKELALFAPFAVAGEAVFRLPLSFLRRMAIKPQQDKIIKGNSSSRNTREMKGLYSGQGMEDYEVQLGKLKDLLEHFGKLALASCYALAISRGRSEEELAQNLKAVDFPIDDFTAAVEDADANDTGMALAAWPDAMLKAWNGINRKGFIEAVELEDKRDHGFTVGASAVIALRAHLERYRKTLLSEIEKEGGSSAIFAADLSIVKAVLLLYGETS